MSHSSSAGRDNNQLVSISATQMLQTSHKGKKRIVCQILRLLFLRSSNFSLAISSCIKEKKELFITEKNKNMCQVGSYRDQHDAF